MKRLGMLVVLGIVMCLGVHPAYATTDSGLAPFQCSTQCGTTHVNFAATFTAAPSVELQGHVSPACGSAYLDVANVTTTGFDMTCVYSGTNTGNKPRSMPWTATGS